MTLWEGDIRLDGLFWNNKKIWIENSLSRIYIQDFRNDVLQVKYRLYSFSAHFSKYETEIQNAFVKNQLPLIAI